MKIRYLYIVLTTIFIFGCNSSKHLDTVKIESGLLKGTSENGVSVFKGVPYAEPPVGKLRWCPPLPPLSWDSIKVANKYSANPIQHMVDEYGPWTSEYQPQGEISEDCLYLNIWTAAKSSEEKRSVLVYIPGGAFTGGSGNVPVYNGENIAKKGIVVVTINYRVEVIGFLAHPELTKESENNSSGNYGLLDQLQALKWVQQNISEFGGDPNSVTVMGQSAGAASVHALLRSPLAKGLFQRTIAMSGSSARMNDDQTLAQAEENGLRFAETANSASLEELRKMPAEELLAISRNNFRFHPIADGWYIPEDENYFSSDVVTMTGFVADEGSFSDDYGKLSAEDFKKQVNFQAGNLADQVLKLYPVSTKEESIESQKSLRRDFSMVSMYAWAKEREKLCTTDVYTYLFDHQQPGKTREQYLTFHSSELPYVFNNLSYSPRPWEDEDTKIADMMSDYWKNFISKGDPNGDGLLYWPEFSLAPEQTMELGNKMKPRLITSTKKFEILKQLIKKKMYNN